MKMIGVIFALLASCLSVSNCKDMSNKEVKIQSPMIVSVFATGTTMESYLIIVSEDGTIETLFGQRKEIEIEEGEYKNDPTDLFIKIESREKRSLDQKEIMNINDLLDDVSFSEIQSQRTFIYDVWERMLFINSKPYYIYGLENEDASLRKLIEQIIEYSPIEVVMRGFA